MGNSYDEFADRYNRQWPAVFAVARWLHANGHSINIAAPNLRPRNSDYRDYQDSGDLFAEKDGKRKRIEVKGRNVDFTCAEDWPYKEGAFVCSVKSYSGKEDNVTAWISVSRDLNYAMITRTEDNEFWVKTERYDRPRERTEDFWLCPLEKVIFRKIKQEL